MQDGVWMDFFESDMCNQNLTPDMLKKIAGDKSKKVDVHDKFVEFLYDGTPVDVSHRDPNLRILISVSDNKLIDKNLSSKID